MHYFFSPKELHSFLVKTNFLSCMRNFCSCGAVENNKHFLLECPAFNDIRQDMLNEIISVTNPTVDILLFGNTALNDEANSFIFRSVQKFILRSKRFKTKQSENNED